MKKLLLLFALIIAIAGTAQTQGNFPIPSMFVGIWTNAANNDTLTITADSITWTSNQNETFVSYVDYIVYSSSSLFSFYAYPNVYVLNLEKISRIKLIFNAQTQEGYDRRSDIYLKQTRS